MCASPIGGTLGQPGVAHRKPKAGQEHESPSSFFALHMVLAVKLPLTLEVPHSEHMSPQHNTMYSIVHL